MGWRPTSAAGGYPATFACMGWTRWRRAPQGMSRHVGFVFQDPEAQFVMDRVEDEIAFALENAAIPPAEMRVRVEETLDLLDLTPLRRPGVEYALRRRTAAGGDCGCAGVATDDPGAG